MGNNKPARKNNAPEASKANVKNPKKTGGKSQPDVTNKTFTSGVNTSTEASQTICSFCHMNLPGEWVVQCDGCERQFHYSCVGYDETTPEQEPWNCPECDGKVLSSTAKDEPSKEQSADQIDPPNRGDIYASLRREYIEKLKQLQSSHSRSTETKSSENATPKNCTDTGNQTEKTVADLSDVNQQSNQQTSGKISSVNSKSSASSASSEVYTIPTKSQSAHSKSKSVQRTRSSVSSKAASQQASSQRRRDIELQRLQEEYELQTQLDAERLALERKAIELKEQREKKLMEAKYRTMEAIVSECSESTTDTKADTRTSTMVNVNSRNSAGSEMVESWINEQRNQNYRQKSAMDDVDPSVVSSTLGIDVSIPMNSKELDAFSDRKVCYGETDLDPGTKTFAVERSKQSSKPLTSETPAYHWNNNIPTSRTYDGRTITAQSTSGQMINQQYQNRMDGISTGQQFENDRIVWNSRNSRTSQQHVPVNNPILNQNFGNGYPNDGNPSNGNPSNGNPSNGNPSNRNPSDQSNYNRVSWDLKRNGNPSNQQSNYNRISWNLNNQRPNQHSTHINPTTNQVSSNQNGEFRSLSSGLQSNQFVNTAQQSNRNNQIQNTIMLTPNQIASRHSMPKDLPLYYGHPRHWPQFIQRYYNTSKLCGFNDCENLERLNKCLKGKANTIVASLLVMPECVDEIIQTLRDKFGRPELVAEDTLAEIRAEPIIKPDKLEALADFGYNVRNACNVIESMGLHYYLYSPNLIQDIIRKLPYQTKIDWARHAHNLQAMNQQINLRTVAEWLHQLSRTLNQITTLDLDALEEPSQRKTDRKSDNVKSGYLNIHDSKATNETHNKQQKCVCCSNSCKSTGECSKFKSLSNDEKWKCVMDNNLYRKCLKKHSRKNYLDKKFTACGVNGCELKHNSLLHNEERHSKYRTDKSNGAKQKSNSTNGKNSSNSNQATIPPTVTPKTSNTHQDSDEAELFRIVPVKLQNNGNIVKTFAFLDEGSSYTLMEKQMANELNVEGTAETICLLWTKGIHRQEETSNVDLVISGINDNDAKYPLRSVNVVEDLGLSSQSVNPRALAEKFSYLKGLPLPEYRNAVPTILIGIKHIRLTTPLETIEGDENQPIASRSKLGWSVYGPIDGSKTFGYANHHKVGKCPCSDRDDDLHQIVKEHFTIENFGVSINSTNMESKENQKALEMLDKFTVRKGNRFETRLLWKNDAYDLPDSYGMARKRLACVENKGSKVIDVINEIIEDYLAKGYASKLSPAESAVEHPRTFYLPIFTVINPKKPGKIRPVFDAAATVRGVSLNSTLLTGPDLLSPLIDILRRFREHRIAVAGDIKEMFYRVWINEADRHSQRFLWRNGDRSREPDVYQFNVMTFGSKCSPSSAQFVKNKNACEYEAEYPAAARSIIKNHYVDDMLDGAGNVEDAIKLINDVKFVHSQAGFEIRNFKSNSEDVLSAIGEPIEASKVDLEDGDANIERVLGIFWETTSDCFMFSLKYTKIQPELLNGNEMPTKKRLLSLVMSLYDPLGLISYYVIHAKCLLQDVWRSKIGWNETLPSHLEEKWKRWIELLPSVEQLKIPRWYSTKLAGETKNELHIFVDAGEDAFAAVAYVRVADDEGVECSLIGSKARVAPIKYLSIPRKELMAAVLGSRLINSVENGLGLKVDRRVIWSDSVTVLTWLHSEHKRYSQFVAHRIGEILENTNLHEWRWVPSKMNVADEATKWSKKPTFDASERWYTGPQFLQYPESEWPASKTIIPNSTAEEMKASFSHSKLIIPSIVDAKKFSTWQRLVRAVGNAKRICYWMVAKKKKMPLPSLKLSQKDLVNSERRLIHQAQWQGFTEEMVILTRNQSLDPKKRKSIDKGSSIFNCSPYLDEFGVLRVKGRIDSATAVSEDAKRPIILPKDNPITKLIVRKFHVKFKHRNHETVINELRQKYYIPQIRTVLKGVRWNCQLCALRRCKPQPPQIADLPALRFEVGIRPFTFTGLDYFGPLKVKVGRQAHKRWGVIYTCLTTRGIWIDLVPNYDTESCILSIRDFINRKGTVQEFFSDNGTYFVGANNELTREMEKIDVLRLEDEFTSCYTKWRFNPPETGHMGGMWERLIKSVKASLYESMMTRTPTEQMLRSWLIEAENIVNSRPLTFVPIESEEDEALTPNHFILGSSNGMKPPGKFKSDGPFLRSQWKEVQRCTDKFWKRFIHEYIPTLVRRTKWFDPVKPLEVGDIVINFDEDAPRNTYKTLFRLEHFQYQPSSVHITEFSMDTAI